MNKVIYLSDPSPVAMADEWFEIATPEHFWIKRRFEVLRKLGQGVDFSRKKAGEIGCGHGLVQRQLEQQYGLIVDGFDLNEHALCSSVAGNHPRYCYNVFDRNPRFAASYDLLVLFDVLEHIKQDQFFLEAVLFHLRDGGHLLVNVPAFMSFHSSYDQVVGHQRRYTLETLEVACSGVGLKQVAVTYWGLPFVPLLLLRKLWLAGQTDPLKVTRRGYHPPGRFANLALTYYGRLEPVPQRLLGTSLMAIYHKQTTP